MAVAVEEAVAVVNNGAAVVEDRRRVAALRRQSGAAPRGHSAVAEAKVAVVEVVAAVAAVVEEVKGGMEEGNAREARVVAAWMLTSPLPLPRALAAAAQHRLKMVDGVVAVVAAAAVAAVAAVLAARTLNSPQLLRRAWQMRSRVPRNMRRTAAVGAVGAAVGDLTPMRYVVAASPGLDKP